MRGREGGRGRAGGGGERGEGGGGEGEGERERGQQAAGVQQWASPCKHTACDSCMERRVAPRRCGEDGERIQPLPASVKQRLLFGDSSRTLQSATNLCGFWRASPSPAGLAVVILGLLLLGLATWGCTVVFFGTVFGTACGSNHHPHGPPQLSHSRGSRMLADKHEEAQVPTPMPGLLSLGSEVVTATDKRTSVPWLARPRLGNPARLFCPDGMERPYVAPEARGLCGRAKTVSNPPNARNADSGPKVSDSC